VIQQVKTIMSSSRHTLHKSRTRSGVRYSWLLLLSLHPLAQRLLLLSDATSPVFVGSAVRQLSGISVSIIRISKPTKMNFLGSFRDLTKRSPIGTLEDIGNGLIRSITRNVETGEIVVEEYKGNLELVVKSGLRFFKKKSDSKDHLLDSWLKN